MHITLALALIVVVTGLLAIIGRELSAVGRVSG